LNGMWFSNLYNTGVNLKIDTLSDKHTALQNTNKVIGYRIFL